MTKANLKTRVDPAPETCKKKVIYTIDLAQGMYITNQTPFAKNLQN